MTGNIQHTIMVLKVINVTLNVQHKEWIDCGILLYKVGLIAYMSNMIHGI